MTTYYTAKVKLETTTDNGKTKSISETYLVDAMSCTEAEAKVLQDLKGSGLDFEVKSVSQSRIIKII